MALTVAELNTRLTLDAKEFQRGIDKAEKHIASFGKAAGKLGDKMMRGVTLPIVGAGAAAFKMASDLNESLNAVDIAFGRDAREVQKWAKNLDSAFGFTQRDALDAAASFQLVAKDAGFTGKQITDLAERAADMGSVFNVSSAEAAAAIKSGLVGETEPLRRFGVVLSQAAIEAKAVAMGVTEAGKEMTVAEKQAATYALIMEQTSIAQGDATNTADSAAGKMRVLKADMGRAAEEIGQKLIPAASGMIGKLNGMVTWLDSSGVGADKLLISLGALAAAGPVLKGIELATKGVAAAQWTWNAAVHAHPLAGLIGATVVLHEWVERTTGGLDGMRQSLFSLTNPIREMEARLRHLGDILNNVRSKIPGIGFDLPRIGLPKFHDGGVVPGPRGADVPIMAQAGETVIPANGSAGGQPIVINVYGVLDGADGARKIQEVLLAHQRRSGSLGFR